MAPLKLSPKDPSSFSRPEEVCVTKIKLDLKVNFTNKTLCGHVELEVEKINKSVNVLILDAKNLKISKVLHKESGEKLKYTLSDEVQEFGEKLTIDLPPKYDENLCVLIIFYDTSPEASGLQWLTPDQTCGKHQPFLFSQFQAIHARSVLPCQDTPSVKTPYVAKITAPAELTVVMSAIPQEVEQHGLIKVSTFEQSIPIPSYLIAIAIGALESRRLGPRSHVWAEIELIDQCVHEFAETEHQLATAEEICGPYVWGIYDLLVLPPSFAFGGMENPCLTFVTPTLLAGDRSLANVVAHEIAHSWTGNLITNKNFEHFWLNEGFTVFVERKIKGRLTSILQQDFDAFGGLAELTDTINLLGKTNPLTKLVVNLEGVHPDDAFSTVPYEKGYIFLRYLEKIVGGHLVFEQFLKKYFEVFKYKSIDTDDFKHFFEKYFLGNAAEIKNIDWNAWLYNPGFPIVIPSYSTALSERCDIVIQFFLHWDTSVGACPISADNAKSLSSDQVIYILQKLIQGEPLPRDKVEQLDVLFNLSNVKNSEIKFRWLRLGIKAKWPPSVASTLEWITNVGRMKFVRPLYRELYAWVEVRDEAVQHFLQNRHRMMHVVAYTVSKDLHLMS